MPEKGDNFDDNFSLENNFSLDNSFSLMIILVSVIILGYFKGSSD